MANELLDDIDYIPEKEYHKQLKGTKKLFFASLLIGIPCIAVTMVYSPTGFEKAARLPKNWAEPVVFGSLGIAGFLMLICIFKMYKYWAAKKKYYASL